MFQSNVIIVGAGPAGLMAAGTAAQAGVKTILLEKMPQIANKLRLTGNGRCNITNIAAIDECIDRFFHNGRFLRQAFSRFSNTDLLDLLNKLGVSTKAEDDGKIFPENMGSNDVIYALAKRVSRNRAEIRTRSPVKNLVMENNRIVGITLGNGEKIPAHAVIIATGGMSYASTGSTGDGYALAQSAGHTIIPGRPALVPLETIGGISQKLQGVSLRNIALLAVSDIKKIAKTRGEILFTHFGVSGPAILSISGAVVDALNEGEKITLTVDLMPDYDEKELDDFFVNNIREHANRRISTMLDGLFPSKLALSLAGLSGLAPDKVCREITKEERKKLCRLLKDLELGVKSARPFSEAMVTAGGVNVKEIDPRTMASRLVKGLYFAGEVIDIDADTGGFNLQAAFSTGWVAGNSAVAQK